MNPAPTSEPLRPLTGDRARALHELDHFSSNRIVQIIIEHRMRLWPLALVFVSLIVWIDASAWRLALIVGSFALLSVLAWFERRGARLGALSREQIMATAWCSGIAQLGAVFAVGGLAGPIAPALPLVALVMNLIAPGRIAMFFVLLVQIPAVWLFAWVQSEGMFVDLVPSAWAGLFAPPGTPGPGPWIAAAFMTFVLLGAMKVGRVMRTVLLGVFREQLEERDEQLEMHAESARTLSRLSAEIAHELKNPLASIKGLAALVRKDLEGVPAERMDVLRREVDRMQSILEEFLNYSRPLVPIDEERVDLVELGADVLALHEAMAAQAMVHLDAPLGEVHLSCDPRKIRQVLINLVQNAIDASPAGGRVKLEVARDEAGASIRVLDQGAGLAHDVHDKLFGVGFTTKDHGTGLGLVVARGLARQHGGELTLENRPGGGCVATLRLPLEPRERSSREDAKGALAACG